MLNPDEEPRRYTNWGKVFTVFGMAVAFSSFMTDIHTGITYAKKGHIFYAILTWYFLALSTLIVHGLSAKWHIQEKRDSNTIRFAAILGITHRHWRTLQAGSKANASGNQEDFLQLYQCESDVAFLALYTAFLKSAPQLVLQTCVNLEDQEPEIETFASALLSTVLLAVGVTMYDRNVRLYLSKRKPVSWWGVIIQGLWRLTSIAPRIIATVLVVRARDCRLFFAFFLGILLLLAFVATMKKVHKLHRMTLCEDFVHTFAVGAAFTFGFINVYDKGHVYSVVVHQCIVGLLNMMPFAEYSGQQMQVGASLNSYVADGLLMGSQLCGVFFMAVYLKYFYTDGTAFLIPYRVIHEEENKLVGSRSLVEDSLPSSDTEMPNPAPGVCLQ